MLEDVCKVLLLTQRSVPPCPISAKDTVTQPIDTYISYRSIIEMGR